VAGAELLQPSQNRSACDLAPVASAGLSPATYGEPNRALIGCNPTNGGFYIFIFFISIFYKNIFLIWKFTEIYPVRPAAGGPGPARPAAGRQRLICKKKMKKNCR